MLLSRNPYTCLHCAAVTTDAAATSGGASTPTPASLHGGPSAASSIRAQDDFFRHVNGAWLAATPIPPDKARIGAFEQIHDEIQLQLRALIEKAAAPEPSTTGHSDADAQTTPPAQDEATARTEARKIGDLYASFMDEAALETLGLQPLAAQLAAIDAVASPADLAVRMAHLERLGVGMPIVGFIRPDARDSSRYVPYLQQEGLGLPDRDYYLQDDGPFAAIRDAYLAHLAQLLRLAHRSKDEEGESVGRSRRIEAGRGASASASTAAGAGAAADANAEAAAQAILALETDLARAQWSRVDNRDPVRTYNPVALDALPALAPGLDWPAWLAETGYAGRTPHLVVRQPSYLTAFAALLHATPLATWKAYLRTRLLGAYAPFLHRAFVDERFAFAGTVLRGTPENLPRWKRAAALVDEALGDALGRLYVRRHFPPTHKQRMEALVERLMQAYRASIDQLDWMGPATRREAQAKLERLRPKIGYPDKGIDYTALDIRRADLAGNVMRARAFEHARQVAKLGAPIDRDEWFMTPQTVNAYYDPAMNEIVFPASILQPPFFDADAPDDAENFGAIGAVIGHEISHGYDDQGSQYDATGNLRDWWQADDRARFDAKTRRLVQQYGAYEPLPGVPLNGELSLGENIADNSGLAIAWKAWRLSLGGQPAPVIDGLSGEARFFHGFARVWRGKSRDEALMQQIKAGPHAPAEFRANGTVRNHPGFHETFAVQPGDGMYLAPQERVSIW